MNTKMHSILFFIILHLGISCGKTKYNILDSSRYLKLNEIYDFLKKISNIASKHLKLQVIGNTHIQGKNFQNDIYVVKIGNADKIFFFDCGIHAREWISPATCLFLIQKLAEKFDVGSPTYDKKDPLLQFQWQFVPLLNPDGYQLSHRDNATRLARKNGRPFKLMNMKLSKEYKESCKDCFKNPEQLFCSGVDLNRNFPAGWGKGTARFVYIESNIPCNEVYKGLHPLSEPESQAIDKYVSSIEKKVLAAFSVHSFGKQIYHSMGWLKNDAPGQITGERLKKLIEFAKAFNKHIQFHIGTVHSLIGEVSLQGGGIDDYYSSVKNFTYSYTIELDPASKDVKSNNPFNLAEKEIVNVGSKMFKALGDMATKMIELRNKDRAKPSKNYNARAKTKNLEEDYLDCDNRHENCNTIQKYNYNDDLQRETKSNIKEYLIFSDKSKIDQSKKIQKSKSELNILLTITDYII